MILTLIVPAIFIKFYMPANAVESPMFPIGLIE